MLNRECKICKTGFRIFPSRLKEKNRGLYCSRKCFAVAQSKSFSMEKNPNWKGGRKKFYGYIQIRTEPNKYEFEHRLVAEKTIGRKLLKREVVHHINGIKDDNRPENLVVLKNRAEHSKVHNEVKSKCPTCHRFMPASKCA